MAEKQLMLFNVTPRDAGHIRSTSDQAGLKSIHIEQFKGFQSFDIDFDGITLLVGANNSGKTSILQAIRLFFWCISVCARTGNTNVITWAKNVMPFNDFKLIPAHELRELTYSGISPNTKERGIVIRGELTNGLSLSFRVYAAYTILMAVEPVNSPPLTKEAFATISHVPLYIPGYFGVVTRELVATNPRLEELLNSGHHNEVLRNLLFRLATKTTSWGELLRRMEQEFKMRGLQVPYDDSRTEYLVAQYREQDNRIPFDLVSAGSGFLQVLQILAHALQNPSPIVLLDEPDAHMHSALQRSFLTLLREFATEQKLQVVMASHSETFIRCMDPADIRVVDRQRPNADRFRHPTLLEDNLRSAGIWPDQLELAEILRTRRVLLLEGKTDTRYVDSLGERIYPDWTTRRRLIQPVKTEGSSDSIVENLKAIVCIMNDIMDGKVKMAHFRDRDLLTDEAVDWIRSGTVKSGLPLLITERRNRESFMIEPKILAQAILLQCGGILPTSYDSVKAIEAFIENQILDWCDDELDRIPSSVEQYNLPWIKKRYTTKETYSEAERRLKAFIRQEWYDPVKERRIPWKLVDGKGVLKRIRIELEKQRISLPEKTILAVMEPKDFGEQHRELIDLLYGWTV